MHTHARTCAHTRAHMPTHTRAHACAHVHARARKNVKFLIKQQRNLKMIENAHFFRFLEKYFRIKQREIEK